MDFEEYNKYNINLYEKLLIEKKIEKKRTIFIIKKIKLLIELNYLLKDFNINNIEVLKNKDDYYVQHMINNNGNGYTSSKVKCDYYVLSYNNNIRIIEGNIKYKDFIIDINKIKENELQTQISIPEIEKFALENLNYNKLINKEHLLMLSTIIDNINKSQNKDDFLNLKIGEEKFNNLIEICRLQNDEFSKIDHKYITKIKTEVLQKIL